MSHFVSVGDGTKLCTANSVMVFPLKDSWRVNTDAEFLMDHKTRHMYNGFETRFTIREAISSGTDGWGAVRCRTRRRADT